MNFDPLQKAVLENFKRMSKEELFVVDIDRDKIIEVYLSGFDAEFVNEHTCNCCKNFLRNAGGIVYIKDNKVVSIWDGVENEEYAKPIANLRKYVKSLPIKNVFLTDINRVGTQQNFDTKDNVTWTHFFIDVPNQFKKSKDDLDTLRGQKRTNHDTLKRALEELSLNATEITLDLISQDSLYRGKEYEKMLKEFLKIQKQYGKLNQYEKSNYIWLLVSSKSNFLSSIRNSAIGTLLIDLSQNMELDAAVTRFEKVMAPTNYKRPTALVTQKMIQDAQKKIEELGLSAAMQRRYANETDVPIEHTLFVDKSTSLTDVFQDIAKDTVVHPKHLSKTEEISIIDFVNNVLPNAKSVEALVENKHLGNFVSLIAPEESSDSKLLKWNNEFSWSYTGGITDSIKEMVKSAGGKVIGELRVSLSWHNYDDLDLHVKEPNGNIIFFGKKLSSTSGKLDVDMNASTYTRSPVENIIWDNQSTMKHGIYEVMVHNFNKREKTNIGFVVQVEHDGQIYDFPYMKETKSKEMVKVVTFNYSKNGLKIEQSPNIVQNEKWEIKTNSWRKVKRLTLSPNHWQNEIGNKHYLFFLEGCVSDEKPRPFYNEFLNEGLNQHRKVLEIVGGRLNIESTKNQLSGIGFSDTQANHLFVRVEGAFKRILKIKF